jgi:hypothetical protein
MKYLKFTTYLYLLAAIFFVYDGITKLNSGTDMPYLSFFIAFMAIGMFFFRKYFQKRIENENKKQ